MKINRKNGRNALQRQQQKLPTLKKDQTNIYNRCYTKQTVLKLCKPCVVQRPNCLLSAVCYQFDRSHIWQLPFPCDICTFSFNHKSSFRNHTPVTVPSVPHPSHRPQCSTPQSRSPVFHTPVSIPIVPHPSHRPKCPKPQSPDFSLSRNFRVRVNIISSQYLPEVP